MSTNGIFCLANNTIIGLPQVVFVGKSVGNKLNFEEFAVSSRQARRHLDTRVVANYENGVLERVIPMIATGG